MSKKSGKHKEYNGHRSHAAWNVALWLNNDEGLYNMVRSSKRVTRTLDDASERIFTFLEGSKTPDGVPYTKTNIRLAIRN